MIRALLLASRSLGELRRRSNGATWGVALAVGILFLAIAAIASLWQTSVDGQQLAAQFQIRTLEKESERHKRSPGAVGVLAKEASDFVERLPTSIDTQSALLAIQRSASDAGVVFAGVSVHERAATKGQLSRVDLAMTLRGPYPKLIQVLAEALSRHQNATLARASFRRPASANLVEATMEIALWGGAFPLQDAITEGALRAETESSRSRMGR